MHHRYASINDVRINESDHDQEYQGRSSCPQNHSADEAIKKRTVISGLLIESPAVSGGGIE
jgi:hypothetical protein